jgi:hypothetical protein
LACTNRQLSAAFEQGGMISVIVFVFSINIYILTTNPPICQAIFFKIKIFDRFAQK